MNRPDRCIYCDRRITYGNCCATCDVKEHGPRHVSDSERKFDAEDRAADTYQADVPQEPKR